MRQSDLEYGTRLHPRPIMLPATPCSLPLPSSFSIPASVASRSSRRPARCCRQHLLSMPPTARGFPMGSRAKPRLPRACPRFSGGWSSATGPASLSSLATPRRPSRCRLCARRLMCLSSAQSPRSSQRHWRPKPASSACSALTRPCASPMSIACRQNLPVIALSSATARPNWWRSPKLNYAARPAIPMP